MSFCTFEFTRNSPLRTVLVDIDTGEAKYQIDTPLRLVGSVTKIRKFDNSKQSSPVSDSKTDPGDGPFDEGKKKPKSKKASANLPENGEDIATVQWPWFSQNVINFLGNESTRKEFLPRCGGLKRNFKFTGPDGVEYMWDLGILGMSSPKLVTGTGKNKTVIAQFYPQIGGACRKRNARLVVHPAGMKMLDQIIATYMFAGKSRRDRERTARCIMLVIIIALRVVLRV